MTYFGVIDHLVLYIYEISIWDPFPLLTRINFNPARTSNHMSGKVGNDNFIHSQTSTVVPLKFGNG